MNFDPMIIALIVLLLAIALSFYKAHMNPNVDFNVFDLLMENGRISKVACMVLGSFAMHTWIMIHLTIHDKMSEGYLTIYGATWVAPLLVKMLATMPKEEKS